MKEFYKFCSLAFFCLALTLSSGSVQAQYYSKTPQSISTSSNSGGFYEFLPPGYNPNGSQTYPLMVFLHGAGELGNGGSELSRVLANGPPKLINNGSFPASFTVSGQTFSFIVICPQFVDAAQPADVDAVINYATSHYKVNTDRIYLTGLSLGGGSTWYYPAFSDAYASKLAALLPISGAGEIDAQDGAKFTRAHLAVYATTNAVDPTVDPAWTIGSVDRINATTNPPPDPRAVLTVFNVTGHDAWSHTYDPAFLNPDIGGVNAYQWMLQHTASGSGVPLPVTLTDYKAFLSSDRSQVTVSWATSMEQNNRYFLLERSADGQQFTTLDTIAAAGPSSTGHQYADIDHNPSYGDNFYRLSQVDLDGKTTYYTVLKVTLTNSAQNSIRLSPNPAGSTVFLELAYPETGNMQVNLSDVQGRLIKTWQLKKDGPVLDQYLDLSRIPPGSYFLRITGQKVREGLQLIRK